jgi:hypothetical protein
MFNICNQLKPRDVQVIAFKNMKRLFFKNSEAVANKSGAMETGDHSKKRGESEKPYE